MNVPCFHHSNWQLVAYSYVCQNLNLRLLKKSSRLIHASQNKASSVSPTWLKKLVFLASLIMGINNISYLLQDAWWLWECGAYIAGERDISISPYQEIISNSTDAKILLIRTLREPQENLKQNSCIFIQESAFENVACEMMAMLSRAQCVNAGLSF